MEIGTRYGIEGGRPFSGGYAAYGSSNAGPSRPAVSAKAGQAKNATVTSPASAAFNRPGPYGFPGKRRRF